MEIKNLECAMEEMFDFIGDIPSRAIDFEFKCDYDAAFAELEKIKSDDVVEVVRCNDCIFSYPIKGYEKKLKTVQEKMGITLCHLEGRPRIVSLNGYCHGGRKQEDVFSQLMPLDRNKEKSQED